MLRLLHPNIGDQIGENALSSTILLLRNQSTLIGSHPDCDIRIKCPGIRLRQALIEFCPRTEIYWLRQLLPFEEKQLELERSGNRGRRRNEMMADETTYSIQPPSSYTYENCGHNDDEGEHGELEEDNENVDGSKMGTSKNSSRKHTREQLLQDGTIVQLRQSDILRFGSGPTAVEFAFKMPPIGGAPERIAIKKRTGSFGGSTRKSGPDQKGCCSLQSDGLSLPIVGSRIQPRAHADRFVRPRPTARLCHRQQGHPKPAQNRSAAASSFQRLPDGVSMLRRSHSTSRIIAIGESSSDIGEENGEWPAAKKKGQRQKVAEEEMMASTDGSMDSTADELVFMENTVTPIGHSSLPPLQPNRALQNANCQNQNVLQPETELKMRDWEIGDEEADGGSKLLLAPSHAHLNEIVYDTFFRVCTEEMDALNKKLSNLPIRDYADIFAEMHKILHEPFSFRLMEVNTKCSLLFESLKPTLKPSDRVQLYVQFDQFLKQKVSPISKPIDSFLCTLRESASMARESARACGVFSQWSREFGDQLQLQPNWDLMLYKVRDLQTRFREYSLPKHWLPPSLMPLLEVLIFERKNWAEERQKREQELADELAEAKQKIIELEAHLEKRPPLVDAPQITLPIENNKNGDISTISRIELHEAKKTGGEKNLATKTKDGCKSPQIFRSVRSDRSSIGSLKLESAGDSHILKDVEDDSRHSGAEMEHINSPNTPPPSQNRTIGPRIGGRKEEEAKLEMKESMEEDEVVPLGDHPPKEEKQEKVGKTIDDKGNVDGGELLSEGGDLESGRLTTARAIRTALAHLNELYEELRAKSRVASPADDDGTGRSKSAIERWRHGSGMNEDEETYHFGSQRSDSNESLVKAESESEDEQQGQIALRHLYSYYRDLEEQRRKSQSTLDGRDGEEEGDVGEEEDERKGEKEEDESKVAFGPIIASDGIFVVEGDQNRLEKIARAEKALLLRENSQNLMEASFLREMPKGKNGGIDEFKLNEDEMEFERIEREVLEAARNGQKNDEENPRGNGKGLISGINRNKAMEFWELASRLAEMLNLDLSMPEDYSDERDTRKKAVDSIMDKLKQILAELKEAQQQKRKFGGSK